MYLIDTQIPVGDEHIDYNRTPLSTYNLIKLVIRTNLVYAFNNIQAYFKD